MTKQQKGKKTRKNLKKTKTYNYKKIQPKIQQ